MKIKKINELQSNDTKLTKFGNWLVEDILDLDTIGPYVDFNYIEDDTDVEFNFYFINPTMEMFSFIYDKLEKSRYVNIIGNIKVGRHDDNDNPNQIYFTLYYEMFEIDEILEDL